MILDLDGVKRYFLTRYKIAISNKLAINILVGYKTFDNFLESDDFSKVLSLYN